MTKIAIISSSLRGGGAEKVLLNIGKYLDRDKFDISMIFINKVGEYYEQVPEDIDTYDMASQRVRNSVFKLIRQLNKIQPDIIFTTMAHLNIFILLIRPFLKGKPKIVIREANTPSKTVEDKKIVKNIFRKIFSTADKLIVQCDEMGRDFMDFYKVDEEKIQRIYNPVDRNSIIKSSNYKNPYNNNEINLLAVGRLSEQKGFDILLKAMSIVKEYIPNIHLTILGQGNQLQDLIILAKELEVENNVSFLGFKKNPYPYYKYADIFVLSSKWEGFPNSMLESLTLGTEIVSTDCKSGPIEILNNGEIGTIVRTNDSLSLAKGIIQGLNNQNKELLIEKSKEFDVFTIIGEYEIMFKSLLSD